MKGKRRDPESFIRTATSQTPKTEKLTIPENREYIRKSSAENAVNGFLEESYITALYRYDLSYDSTLKGQQEIQNQVRQQIESNRNLSRALRFAAGDEKARMEGFKTSLYDRLRANIDSARKQEEENRNRTKQNYEKFLKETDGKAHELNRQAREWQTDTYQNAVSLQERAKTVSDYQAAIAELKKTPGFQDTATRIQICEKAISDIQAQERREKEEQARKAAAKRRRTTIVLSIVAILAVAAFFVVTKVVIPKMHYANSNNLKVVGNVVTFGTYEQDNNTSNGKEAIEWIVLANEGNRSLLISRYALDCRQYNTEYKDVTWETCSLRPWLNSTFLNEAFTTDEQKAILKTSVDNSKSQGNSNWSTSGGNNTTDQIFLLSYAEAGKYFDSDNDRICKPTAYAKAQGAYTNDSGNCWWWLRSPGRGQSNAAGVDSDGSLGRSCYVDSDNGAVRPAFWINLESDIF